MSDENRQLAGQDQRWFTNHSDSIASATAEPILLVYPIYFRRQLTLRLIIVFLSRYRGVKGLGFQGGLHAEMLTARIIKTGDCGLGGPVAALRVSKKG